MYQPGKSFKLEHSDAEHPLHRPECLFIGTSLVVEFQFGVANPIIVRSIPNGRTPKTIFDKIPASEKPILIKRSLLLFFCRK